MFYIYAVSSTCMLNACGRTSPSSPHPHDVDRNGARRNILINLSTTSATPSGYWHHC